MTVYDTPVGGDTGYGALAARASAVLYENGAVVSNRATMGALGRVVNGIGMYLEGGSATLRNSRFAWNSFPSSGHDGHVRGCALTIAGADCELINLLMFQNEIRPDGTRDRFGAAAYLWRKPGARVIIENATIADNFPDALRSESPANNIRILNSIFWDNNNQDFLNFASGEGAFEHSLSALLVSEEQGNITGDPLFVSAAAGNYRLQSVHGRLVGGEWVYDAETSPAIDAGVKRDWMDDAVDLDGRARIAPGIPGGAALVDMGAYESHPRVPFGTLIFIR